MIQSLSHIKNSDIENLILEKFSTNEDQNLISSIISMGNNGDLKWIPADPIASIVHKNLFLLLLLSIDSILERMKGAYIPNTM